MNPLRAIGRRLIGLASVVGCWAVMQQAAWAQNQPVEEPPQYVLPYALVILGVALGLMTVLNPSGRREKPREDQFAEKKDKKKKE